MLFSSLTILLDLKTNTVRFLHIYVYVQNMHTKERRDLVGTPTLSGVYLIVNHALKKNYVGASSNIPRRIQEHQKLLMLGEHKNLSLQKDYELFSKDFGFRVIEEVKNLDDLRVAENYHITNLNSSDKRCGYNIENKSTYPLRNSRAGVYGIEDFVSAMKENGILSKAIDHQGPIKFGVILQEMRKNAGLSQEDLSKKLKISRSNISKLESNLMELKATALINWCIVTNSHEILATFILGVNSLNGKVV